MYHHFCDDCCVGSWWKHFSHWSSFLHRRLVPKYWNKIPISRKSPNRWLLNTLVIGCVMGFLIIGYSWNKMTLSDFSSYAIVSNIWCSIFVEFQWSGSPYFTNPSTESSQVGGIDQGSNSRPVFYWKVRAIVELEWCNPIRKLFMLVLVVVLSPYFIFIFVLEILFLARSTAFLEKPEFMQKNLLKELSIIKLKKNGQLCTG